MLRCIHVYLNPLPQLRHWCQPMHLLRHCCCTDPMHLCITATAQRSVRAAATALACGALREFQSLIKSRQGEASRTFRLPRDTLAARSFVEHIDEADRFLATPSILQLPSGRILVLFEKCALRVTALHPAAALCPPLVLLGTLGEFTTRRMLREPAHAQS